MKNGMVVDSDGDKYWYLNDVLHRDDGPAQEWADGSKCWYLNGKKHRDDGPAQEWSDGSKYWYLNGKKHRVDGPAVEDGIHWYKKHSVDGPAVERKTDGNYWYLYDKQLKYPPVFGTMEAWLEYLNNNESESYQVIHDINGIIETIKMKP